MKKIFTLTILSLMAILTIVNSCSKSSDSSTTPTPTPTPTNTVGVDSVIVDGGTPIELRWVGCNVQPGNNIFIMTFADNNNLTYLNAVFWVQPATAGNYNIKFTAPASASDIQLKYSPDRNITTYTAQTGIASVSFVNNKIQVSFSKISFIHGTTTKVVSSIIQCQ